MPEKINQFKGEYRFLSNFYPSKIEYDGIIYPSNENFFQAMKCIDKDVRKIFSIISASESKKLGRNIKRQPNWDDIKLKVMETGLRLKFKDIRLNEMLLNTGDAILEEGNNWNDRWWGIDLNTGIGENNLGKLLMKIRQEIEFEENIF